MKELEDRLAEITELEKKIKGQKYRLRDDARAIGYKVDFIIGKLIKK